MTLQGLEQYAVMTERKEHVQRYIALRNGCKKGRGKVLEKATRMGFTCSDATACSKITTPSRQAVSAPNRYMVYGVPSQTKR